MSRISGYSIGLDPANLAVHLPAGGGLTATLDLDGAETWGDATVQLVFDTTPTATTWTATIGTGETADEAVFAATADQCAAIPHGTRVRLVVTQAATVDGQSVPLPIVWGTGKAQRRA